MSLVVAYASSDTWRPMLSRRDFQALESLISSSFGAFEDYLVQATEDGIVYIAVVDNGHSHQFVPVPEDQKWHYAEVDEGVCLAAAATVAELCEILLRHEGADNLIPMYAARVNERVS